MVYLILSLIDLWTSSKLKPFVDGVFKVRAASHPFKKDSSVGLIGLGSLHPAA